MINIDYPKLFKQQFDPRKSLFDKIIENVPSCKNRIQFDDQLNKFAKDDVLHYISKKSQPETSSRALLPSFEPNTYSEFSCHYLFQNKNSQDNIKNEIINDVFDKLKSKEIFNNLSKNNIDLIGIYLFISKTGYIICFVNCAQSSLDMFSPEKFLNVLKQKGSFKQDIILDSDNENGIQSLATKFASEFTKFNRDAQKEFKSLFKDKYSYNSAYFRFTVTSDKNNQIVDLILNNSSLKTFLDQTFDKIGVQLFNVGNQKQVLLIISNSSISPPKGQDELNQFGDVNSDSELFDDSIITIKKTSKNKDKNKKRKSNDEDEYDENDTSLLKLNEISPISHKQNEYDTDDEEEDIFDNLPQFNSPSPVRIKLDLNPISPQLNDNNSPTSILKQKLNNENDSKNDDESYNEDEDYDSDFSDLPSTNSLFNSPLLQLSASNSKDESDSLTLKKQFSNLQNSPLLNFNSGNDSNKNDIFMDGEDDDDDGDYFSDLRPQAISPNISNIDKIADDKSKTDDHPHQLQNLDDENSDSIF